MGKHDESRADRLHQEAGVIRKQRQAADLTDDECAEWKAYADRCFDYGLQQGQNLQEAERVRVFEEGLRTGLEAAVAKSDVLHPPDDPSNN